MSRHESVVERLTPQERHREIRDFTILSYLMNGDDIFVVDGGCGSGFAKEPVASTGACRLRRMHCLQGDLSLQLRIFGHEDNTHSATADYLKHTVVPQAADFVVGFGWCEEIVIAHKGIFLALVIDRFVFLNDSG